MNKELDIDILKQTYSLLENIKPLPCGYVVRPEIEQALYQFINERTSPIAITSSYLWRFYGIDVYSKIQKSDIYVFYNEESMKGYLSGLISEDAILQILKDTK